MNRTPDVDLVLREYLADDGLTAPDDILDTVAAQIGRQRQRRTRRLSGRLPMRTRQLTALVAVVAVAALALVAFSVLPLGGGPRGTETPREATPTAASVRQLIDGELSAGAYETHPFGGANAPIKATLRVPSGWSGFGGWALIAPNGTGAPDGIGVALLAPSGLFKDPCHWDAAGDGHWPQPGDSEPMRTPADYTRALMYSYEGHRTPASENRAQRLPGAPNGSGAPWRRRSGRL